jgi:hypothetical protein
MKLYNLPKHTIVKTEYHEEPLEFLWVDWMYWKWKIWKDFLIWFQAWTNVKKNKNWYFIKL